MTKHLTARGMIDFNITPTKDPQAMAMVITHTDKKQFATLINPEALGVILEQALGLAAHWADEPDLEIETLTGPQSALPASHLSIDKGRHDKEVSLNVYVGKMRMTYLVPIDVLMNSFSKLIPHLDTTDAHEIKPN